MSDACVSSQCRRWPPAGCGWTVRETPHDLFDSQAVQGFRELLPAAEENVGAGLCHPDRAACGPFRTSGGDAGLSTQGGGGERKVVSPQLPAFVCPGVLQLEKDMAKLADLLGHASVETTRIYIMESGAEHKRQVERLGLVI